tara:strand:+ start:331 stop:495 length:165 start_codon:yes stop_codon:yes gene_type:complete
MKRICSLVSGALGLINSPRLIALSRLNVFPSFPIPKFEQKLHKFFPRIAFYPES